MDQERTNRVQAVYDLWDCSYRPRIQKVIADALEHSDEKTNGSLLTFETGKIVEYQTLTICRNLPTRPDQYFNNEEN